MTRTKKIVINIFSKLTLALSKIYSPFQTVLAPFRPVLAPLIVLLATLLSLFVIKTWSGGSSRVADQMQAELNRQHERFSAQLAASSRAVIEFQARTVSAEKRSGELQSAYELSQRELTQTQRALRETQRALTQSREVTRKIREENALFMQRQNTRFGAETNAGFVSDTPAAGLPTISEQDQLRRKSQIASLLQLERDLGRTNQAWGTNYLKFTETWNSYIALKESIDQTERSLALALAPGDREVLPAFKAPSNPISGKFVPSDLINTRLTNVTTDSSEIARLNDDALVSRIEQRSDSLVEAQSGLERIARAIDETNAKIIAGQDQLRNLQAKLTSLSR
jgi:hypothetical protein